MPLQRNLFKILEAHLVFKLNLLCIIFLLIGCSQPYSEQISFPTYFPQDNRIQFDTVTQAQIQLGKKLFFDTRLSIDNTVSCGTCHLPHLAFTDGKKISKGLKGHFSRHNASTLMNIGFSPTFMFDNRAQSLEIQSLIPLHDTNEMGGNINAISAIFEKDQEMQKLAKKAYGTSLDGYALTRSLAAFIKSLIAADSKYDAFLRNKDTFLLTKDEQLGMKLFFGNKAKCNTCHSAPLFSNHKHYDLGIEKGNDRGLMGATHKKEDSARFKTPTLRNITVTAPYFHDGSAATLEEVIKIKCTQSSKDYQAISLSAIEQKQIIAFLKTLTDKKYMKPIK
jgi:cytochrome c peroxidase